MDKKIKKIVYEYFNYVDEDFINLTFRIIENIHNFENEDEITESFNCEIIWYNDMWAIMKHYQNPTYANWDRACETYYEEILEICNLIAKGG